MKVLVVDDSALMRKHLRHILEGAGFDVETARNGSEALDKVADYDPKVITLDINMPVMDGLTCLGHIMQDKPTPVVMVSSLTEKGALVTFEALELGAIDYVAKPGGTVSLNIDDIAEELVTKVKSAARVRMGKTTRLRDRLREQRKKNTAQGGSRAVSAADKRVGKANVKTSIKTSTKKSATSLVVIGVSTGGPGTVEEILSDLPDDFKAPILIAQHMPGRFTKVFAGRLDKTIALTVQELNRPTLMEAGHVYIAQGNADAKLVRRGGKLMATSVPISDQYLWHPSVERLVISVKELCDPEGIICVQLTGMGNDGAKTMAELHEMGARTIAESEDTAVVYGMPRELVALNGADCILPSHAIAQQLVDWVM